jgi:glycosyltransferase involved in cell wall biosynthesis
MSGGLERIITFKANYFAEHLGYDVTLLTSEQVGKQPYYKLSSKVKHVDLLVCFDMPGQHQSFVSKAVQYPFRYRVFKKRFNQFLLQHKPDITISTLRRELNFINTLQDGSIKIGEFHVTRSAYHANALSGGNVFSDLIKKYWSKQFLENISRLSKFVLLTEEEKGNWSELDNTLVINNPLPFFPQQVSACTNKQVIAVGRYTAQKGFDMLIDAWKLVSEEHPDWILTIYGEGDREGLMKQIRALDLEDTCLLQPPVTEITSKYVESSLFVLSSRFEGFGMVIVEAMACGVPPVSFACPCGPKDIINNGVDGLLVEKDNIKELAASICHLIEHDEVRKAMGTQARISSERFKMEYIAGQWKSLFESLIASKK